KKKGLDYIPRTKHLGSGGWAKYTNRLFLETSPYLLQHAHNPVNWYPWGDEAFQKAKELNRPVLLSIGYSTCHWCHIMEEESFEDVDIAENMNRNYITIKVDREERPDVDAIYMAAVQAINGSGGWPMTVWLTPDRKPMFGATYIPARDGDRGTRTGFLTMLNKFKEIYDKEPEKVAESAKKISDYVKERLESSDTGGLPDQSSLHIAMNYYKQAYDPIYGGMNQAPKFPSSMPNRLLLRYYRRTGDKKFLEIAENTLKKMASGGMYDHVGGGFHRYSTDSRWLVPHFEKMLYDNALLAIAYTEAYQVTKDKEYQRVAREILDYVLRDMTSPEGAFYSATDADSIGPKGHREEGYFFTWTPGEIDQVLSEKEAKLVKAHYQVTSKGNFEGGRTIFNTPDSLSTVAKRLGLNEKEARETINQAREKLYQERKRRPLPIRDEKILTAWNGLMISAFAKASFVFNEERYEKAAVNAAKFIANNLIKKERLYRSYKDDKAKFNAYLDDYAFYIAGLMDVYEATSDITWLKSAIALDETLAKHYEDKKNGGFFMTSNDHEKLLAREKPSYDGAEPSGNSIQVMNLLRLYEFTTNDSYRQRAEKTFKAFSQTLKQNSIALSEMLLAFDFYLDKPMEIIIVRPTDAIDEKFTPILREKFLPNKIVSVITKGEQLKQHAQVIPLVEGKVVFDDKVTAYVCRGGVCKLPTTETQIFLEQINEVIKFKEN
ncbi:MAG: thioredoxin domain-containing protein, partial [Bdellovibrionales bacterium]|nr:thioredoxin domain-containing protein [Bdellovibrionales bacterium]